MKASLSTPPLGALLRRLALAVTAAGSLAACGASGSDALAGSDGPSYADAGGPVRTVIHVSVDGLRPDAVTEQLGRLPAFRRLRAQGAFTDNARTTPGYSNTLPNHASQLTGRVVLGEGGHGWTTNRDPGGEATLHDAAGAYVASVFGVAHDAGLQTALYASKSKFALFDRSYGRAHGAPDTTGADDGRDKVDRYYEDDDTARLVRQMLADLARRPPNYAFLHLRDPDAAGHRYGWRTSSERHPYMQAVRHADRQIGRLLARVDRDPRLAGHTVVIVTADHGGSGLGHGSHRPTDSDDYTVPFYVWGAGVVPGDLYGLNAARRADPGGAHPGADADGQPVRNGDAANLALGLLGLGPVPGSTIGADRPLLVSE